MLDFKLALKIASRLTTVAEFPRNQEAIDAVAEDLIDLTRDCDDIEAERRARLVCEEIRRTWDFWVGESDLIRLYRRHFPKPREVKSEDNEAKNYGKKPKIECKTCNDTGAYRPGGRESKEPYVWCDCLAGVNLHFDMQGWLELLNGEQPPPPPAEPVKPHPAAEKPVSAEIEKTLTLNPACSACVISTMHTHAEFWKYHCKQETPQA